ncbi:MAG: bifunctional phosphoribosylaminoimidazolecarboxamide formyltransferase/IMP cyclohydrolase [Firmicutes bacterium]|nr:bifunctional phosphoribosylaminoimidazolecarboxamide formyltransferase/IMP cyclohydrolase [Bacillota bacterium]
MEIKRALISVFDKTGVVELARELAALGVEIVSTGGTASTLQKAGLAVTSVEQVTGSPEILDGRVKSLHPRIHGGILARRDLAAHRDQLQAHEIQAFDLVVVNLYPFSQTIADPDCTQEQALEMIDIGGPAMLRAAAKNFPWVLPLCRPADYGQVISALKHGNGFEQQLRRELATAAFAHTAAYDAAVSAWLTETEYPEILPLALEKRQDLRYGENPQQHAALYTLSGGAGTLAATSPLQGKELSYNNLNDADAAFGLVAEFDQPAAVAVKHAVPCGVGIGETIAQAFSRARDSDPVSIFGGIIALNRSVDAETASLLKEIFLEVIIAPEFDADAREILAKKKNLRLLQCPVKKNGGRVLRSIAGGVLVQDADLGQTDEELDPDALLAWLTVKHAKSNAIVLAKDGRTLGIGSGATSRIDAARVALNSAAEAAKGAVLASDGFIPFPDVVEAAAAAGIATIVQPGGSKGDPEVMAAAEKAGITMILTGIRHFRH